jgi:hypothetical protein
MVITKVYKFSNETSLAVIFKFIEEIPIISNELLMDVRSTDDRIYYGKFDELQVGSGGFFISDYWGYTNLNWTSDNDFLFNSVNVSVPSSASLVM